MKGFALIEFFVFLACFGIIVAIALSGYNRSYNRSNRSNISYGMNGSIENRCINGLSFIINQRGNVTQIMDSYGRGVACVVN